MTFLLFKLWHFSSEKNELRNLGLREDVAVLLTGCAHGWRVNNRHQLLSVLRQQLNNSAIKN